MEGKSGRRLGTKNRDTRRGEEGNLNSSKYMYM